MKILRISYSVPAVVGITFEMDADIWNTLSDDSRETMAIYLAKEADRLVFDADISDDNVTVCTHVPKLEPKTPIAFEADELEVEGELS